MSHILKNKLSIDVDVNPATGWPNGLTKLAQVRIDLQPISVTFYDPRQNWVTPAFLDAAKIQHGFINGLRFVPNGWGDTARDASVVAREYSDHITRLESDGKRRIEVVEWDVETKNIAWQTEFLLGSAAKGTKGIRGARGLFPNPSNPASLGYRWGRPGVWTMEGRQSTATSVAHLAAKTGLLIGPQVYPGAMNTNQWSLWYEIRTWVLNTNPDRPGAFVPLAQFIPYIDAAAQYRLAGDIEGVLFATSRLTELYS